MSQAAGGRHEHRGTLLPGHNTPNTPDAGVHNPYEGDQLYIYIAFMLTILTSIYNINYRSLFSI